MSDNPVKWTAAGLTPAGNALQAALLGTGDGLTFTRAAAADAEGVERLDLTLQAPCTVDGPKCRVPVLLTNVGVETAFTMTELRFYVRRVTDGAPTGEEILYATVTDETGDPIPTAAQSPGFTIDWAFVFQYGNAGNVTVTLDPVGLVSIGMVGRPGGVAVLGDNGAVPIEQGGTGATTVQGVVDAFGIFLAISAAAAYDPEGSYAVGDYCTQGGKLYKCGTPIESGEAWNAAHWTETTVVAELGGKANAAPPEEYAIVPKNGAQLRPGYKNSYYKDQFGRVVGNFAFTFVSLPSTGAVLFSLPQGFCPNAPIDAVAWCYDDTGENHCCVINIASDGEAALSHDVPSGRNIISMNGTFVF